MLPNIFFFFLYLQGTTLGLSTISQVTEQQLLESKNKQECTLQLRTMNKQRSIPATWFKKNLNSVSLILTQAPVTLRVRGAKSL